MRGRHPAGPEAVQRLEGSPQARQRLQTILEVVAGLCRVADACQRLALSPSRLEQLRQRAWQAALAALEPQPGGRPQRVPDPHPDRVALLEARVRELERDLALAQAREELACLPRPTPNPDREKKLKKHRPRSR
jgi:hypothetical protein